jgi:prevent-host-death family protein
MKTSLPIRLRPRRPTVRQPRRGNDLSSQVNIHTAKTNLSRLLARVEKGEHIIIARAGQPVAVITPPPIASRPAVSPDDPLLNLAKHGFNGPGGVLTNQDIDRLVYGV